MADNKLLLPLEGRQFPLPSRLKRKFESRGQKARPLSLESLENRLQAAEERRESLRQERRARAARRATILIHDPQAALERLERRLAAAEAKRAAALHAVRLRAAVTTSRAAAVARSAAHRRHQMTRRLEQSLAAAGEARAAHIAGTAARAAKAATRAHSTGRAARQREQTEAALRLTTMLHRMKRATASREHALIARRDSAAAVAAAAVQSVNSDVFGQDMDVNGSVVLKEQLSVADAMGLNAGEWLRRQAAARRLQRTWRAFAAGPGTTAQLAAAFAVTGIAFSVATQGSSDCSEEEDGSSGSGSEASSDAEKEGSDGCITPPRPLRGPCTPPIAVPLPAATTTADASGDPTNADAATPPTTIGANAAGMAWSLSPRGNPSDRLASSLAEMAAASALGEEAPAPRPASLHHRINAPCALSFDDFAEAMSAPGTLRAAQALLRRLATAASTAGALAGAADVSGLLRRLFPRLPAGTTPDRYPPRAFLCAYMVLAHPEVVLSGQGPREEALATAAAAMVASFEVVLARVLPPGASGASKALRGPLADALQNFDQSWAFYLEQFVAWKSHDAAGLEAELIRAAVELETSRLAKIAATRERGGAGSAGSPQREALRARAAAQDMEALVEGVDHDLGLIEERVRRLTGTQGAARLAAALAAARAAAEGSNSAIDPLRASPSHSPAKKVPRRGGSYRGSATAPPTAADAPGSPTALPVGKPTDSTKFDTSNPSSQVSGAPGARESTAAAGTASDDGNVALMWHLLYNATWQMPTADVELAWSDALGETDPVAEGPVTVDAATAGALLNDSPEATTAALHSCIRRIAEKAFWDGIAERLTAEGPAGGAAVAAVAGLLADAGASLAEVLSPGLSVAADVTMQLGDAERLMEALTPAAGATTSQLPSLNCSALFSLLEWTSALLRRLGAPAREGAATAAAAAVRRDITAAAAAGDAGGTAAAAARALRVITVLLRLLRLDAANAHLRALAAQLGAAPAAAAAYAAAKLAAPGALLGPYEDVLPADVAAGLPQARAWLALASGRLPQIEALLSESPPAAPPAPAPAPAPAGAGAPHRLQTGRKLTFTTSSSSGEGGSGGGAAPRGLAGQLVTPVVPRSWRGLVRAGLAQLVAGEGAVTRLDLPEPLRPDAARLQAAQGEFHHLVALTAALLALRTAGGGGLLDSPESVERVKRRIIAVLVAPDVCLADVAAAVCVVAGSEGDAGREAAVAAVLRGMLGKTSAALRSITSGLCSALTAHLVLGPGGAAAGAAAAPALARCGAGALSNEVVALAERLGEVAAVTEAVCGPWYETLAADLI